jgi:hypothetical protein
MNPTAHLRFDGAMLCGDCFDRWLSLAQRPDILIGNLREKCVGMCRATALPGSGAGGALLPSCSR